MVKRKAAPSCRALRQRVPTLACVFAPTTPSARKPSHASLPAGVAACSACGRSTSQCGADGRSSVEHKREETRALWCASHSALLCSTSLCRVSHPSAVSHLSVCSVQHLCIVSRIDAWAT
eukprot:908945-Rhodomonas_salina.1